MEKVTRARIREFLSARRMAVIGLSRKPREYSRLVFGELLKRGVDAVPVNPAAEEIEGKACFKSVKDIIPTPERGVIILPQDKTEQAVLDCAEAGIRDLWLYPMGSGDKRTLALAEEKGLNLITGYCPLMFLPDPAFIHRLHGVISRLLRMYPT